MVRLAITKVSKEDFTVELPNTFNVSPQISCKSKTCLENLCLEEVFSMNNVRRNIKKKTYLRGTSFAVAVDVRRPGQLAAGPEGACVP